MRHRLDPGWGRASPNRGKIREWRGNGIWQLGDSAGTSRRGDGEAGRVSLGRRGEDVTGSKGEGVTGSKGVGDVTGSKGKVRRNS
jgi:hypothetical protein